ERRWMDHSNPTRAAKHGEPLQPSNKKDKSRSILHTVPPSATMLACRSAFTLITTRPSRDVCGGVCARRNRIYTSRPVTKCHGPFCFWRKDENNQRSRYSSARGNLRPATDGPVTSPDPTRVGQLFP